MTSCYWTCWEYFICCVCMWRWRYGIIQKSTIRCIKCISPALLTSNSMRLELKSDTNTHTHTRNKNMFSSFNCCCQLQYTEIFNAMFCHVMLCAVAIQAPLFFSLSLFPRFAEMFHEFCTFWNEKTQNELDFEHFHVIRLLCVLRTNNFYKTWTKTHQAETNKKESELEQYERALTAKTKSEPN